MSDKMDDLFANVKKMVDSGNIPPEIQQMMSNLKNSNNSNVNGNNNNLNNVDLNNILSQVSPEMLNNLSTMLQSSNSNNSSDYNSSSSPNSNNYSGFNIDMNTMMKMKNIISSMNQKNDPRANLLNSLKPYLRDSKKDKVDQYVNLLNMTKIADSMKNDNIMRNNNKENNNNA